VNPIAVAFAVAGLALVAGVGVIAGFLREAPAPVEPLADPLDDRREALLRSLADLEEAHASGALDEAGYLRLREQTVGRMARVLRALDRRDAAPPGSATAIALQDAPAGGARRGAAEPRRVPPWAVAVLIGGTVLAVVVASLARDAEPQLRASTPQASDDPLGFFERRVREHPDDLAARLDLAHRYLDAGMVEDALSEYAVALELDPDDAEALAHVGIILYQNGRPEEALRSVDRALSTDPRYPEGLVIRGVILLRGLDRPEEAISAFETYLDAAPFGVERQTAKDLIAEARAGTDVT
jgi:tetratricopeptide (TPR) repeat protein